MSELIIKSSSTDMVLILSEHNGDYFKANLESSNVNATRDVCAYTDAYGFVKLIEYLASQEKPWKEEQYWESLEGEFRFSASCSALGHVVFKVALAHIGCAEEWLVKTELKYEFGQIQYLAKAARLFFGKGN